MAQAHDFTDLRVWQAAHQLVLLTYKDTKTFPKEEQFGLTSQMRRAGVSITSNIAEGFGRHGAKDKEHFYVMASGSLTELKNQYILAKDLSYIHENKFADFETLFIETKSLLNALLRSHRQNFGS